MNGTLKKHEEPKPGIFRGCHGMCEINTFEKLCLELQNMIVTEKKDASRLSVVCTTVLSNRHSEFRRPAEASSTYTAMEIKSPLCIVHFTVYIAANIYKLYLLQA